MMGEFMDALKHRAKRFVIGLGVGAVILGAKIAVRASAEAAAGDAAADSALAIADKATADAARAEAARRAAAAPTSAAPAPAAPTPTAASARAGAQSGAQSPAQRPAPGGAQGAAQGIAQGPSLAGPPITASRQAAMRVAAATDAHTAAMTDPDASAAVTATTASMVSTPSRPAPGAPTPTTAANTPSRGAPAQPTTPAQPAARGGRPAGQSVSVSVGAAGAEQPGEISFVRETFAYANGGRRDPFVSLMANGDLRPMIADLRLVAVAYDPTGRNSVAIMRDVSTKEQYRVKVGQTLGRMRAARIQPKEVVFTIEEFGLSRQAVLALSDSTTARTK